jgi:CRISPR-associated protein Cas5d
MPYLGVREFPASFVLLEASASPPDSDLSQSGECDLGWMLHDIDFADGMTPRFFRARMQDGVIQVPPLESTEVKT